MIDPMIACILGTLSVIWLLYQVGWYLDGTFKLKETTKAE